MSNFGWSVPTAFNAPPPPVSQNRNSDSTTNWNPNNLFAQSFNNAPTNDSFAPKPPGQRSRGSDLLGSEFACAKFMVGGTNGTDDRAEVTALQHTYSSNHLNDYCNNNERNIDWNNSQANNRHNNNNNYNNNNNSGSKPFLTNKVFIGGLSPSTDWRMLKEYFSAFGRVTDAFVSSDEATGRPRGFGFVTFESREACEAVLSHVESHVVDNRAVECKPAYPKSTDMDNISGGQKNGRSNGGNSVGNRKNNKKDDNRSDRSRARHSGRDGKRTGDDIWSFRDSSCNDGCQRSPSLDQSYESNGRIQRQGVNDQKDFSFSSKHCGSNEEVIFQEYPRGMIPPANPFTDGSTGLKNNREDDHLLDPSLFDDSVSTSGYDEDGNILLAGNLDSDSIYLTGGGRSYLALSGDKWLQDCAEADERKIFVGGLPDVTPAEFAQFFTKFGIVSDAMVMFDRKKKRQRGFGFVTFATNEGVNNSLKLSRHPVKDRMVEVKKAHPLVIQRARMPAKLERERALAEAARRKMFESNNRDDRDRENHHRVRSGGDSRRSQERKSSDGNWHSKKPKNDFGDYQHHTEGGNRNKRPRNRDDTYGNIPQNISNNYGTLDCANSHNSSHYPGPHQDPGQQQWLLPGQVPIWCQNREDYPDQYYRWLKARYDSFAVRTLYPEAPWHRGLEIIEDPYEIELHNSYYQQFIYSTQSCQKQSQPTPPTVSGISSSSYSSYPGPDLGQRDVWSEAGVLNSRSVNQQFSNSSVNVMQF